MPVTPTSCKPLIPVSTSGGTVAGDVKHGIPTDTAIRAGDVLIVSSGTLDEDNSPAVDLVVGVALESSASLSVIGYAPAFPGAEFEANFVTSLTGGTDETIGVIAENLLVREGLGEFEGHAVIDAAAAANVLMTLRYGKQTGPTQQHLNGGFTIPTETYAAGSTINPRVIFTFIETVWASTLA